MFVLLKSNVVDQFRFGDTCRRSHLAAHRAHQQLRRLQPPLPLIDVRACLVDDQRSGILHQLRRHIAVIVVRHEQRKVRSDKCPHPARRLAVPLRISLRHHRPVQTQQQAVQRHRVVDQPQQLVHECLIGIRLHRPCRRSHRPHQRHHLVAVLLRAGDETPHLVESRSVVFDKLRPPHEAKVRQRRRKRRKCIGLVIQRSDSDAHGWIPFWSASLPSGGSPV